MNGYWDIEGGRVDSTYFFKLVLSHFGDATVVFVEGTTINSDVLDCYKRHLGKGKYLPGKQTIWPVSKRFGCLFSESLMNELSQLSLTHAESELMDHFFVYEGDHAILEWHDAFANAILISKSIPEEIVASFASELGLEYGEATFS